MTQQAQVPTGFTKPEWNVYQALVRAGKKPDIDFTFQGALFGGRQSLGGLIIDFLFINPPDLAINVQGEFFHQGLPALHSPVEVYGLSSLTQMMRIPPRMR
jgi:hypothetical protein